MKRTARRVSPLSRQATEAAHCTYDVKLRILRQLPFLVDLADSDIEKLSGFFHDLGYARENPCTFPASLLPGFSRLLREK